MAMVRFVTRPLAGTDAFVVGTIAIATAAASHEC
jgi:hypothetical protein